ncbi:hypothetical protein GLOIN_2v819825 [Rhizophagus clarus]|uniref:Uncharacterized protein n=1 Tax=Rhizophagus clarus TaxID=94130 RepID=A0A8H3R049_9GLOM|nr:hypothetical protein GLOIN_2v819825 [Rhizophagus clarus]
MKKKNKINDNEIVEIITKWINSYNFEPIIFFIPFVILSGSFTFSARTLIRAILFCIITVIPILCTILNLVFDQNLNHIGINYNYDVNGNKFVGLIILCIFQITFMIIVTLLWHKRYWKFLPEFTLTTREEIKRMFTHYVYLISLIHSNIIIIGYWILINWSYRTRTTYIDYGNTLFTDKFFDIIPYPLILFTIMVQKESRLRIFAYYLLSIVLCVLIFLYTVPTCFIPSNYIGTDSIIKNCDFTNQIRWSPSYQISFIIGMVSVLILMLSFFNAYLCQRNFGKKFKVYLDYEVEPIEFEYKNDPLLDQDTDDENE